MLIYDENAKGIMTDEKLHYATTVTKFSYQGDRINS